MVFKEIKFGIYREIEPGIVEVIINEGIDLNAEMIEFAEGVLTNYYGDKEYCLLVDRVYSYSITFAAMQRLTYMKNLAALAIVVHSDHSRHAALIHEKFQDNIKVFYTYFEALNWLYSHLN